MDTRPKARVYDIDDCVFNFLSKLLQFHYRLTGDRIRVEDLQEYELPPSVDETFRKYEYEIYLLLKPKSGAIRAINKAKEDGYKIILLTARDAKFKDITELSLMFHQIDYDEIFFNKNKAFKLNELEKRVYVHSFADDRLKTINNVKRNTKIQNVYLVNMPSNKDKKVEEGVIRIDSLEEIK